MSHYGYGREINGLIGVYQRFVGSLQQLRQSLIQL